MTFLRLALIATTLASGFISTMAEAQSADNAQVVERMDRIEKDLMLMHKQVARGQPVSAVPGGDDTAPSAQLEIRLSGIEEQLRELRGKVEENENRTRKTADDLEKLHRDMDIRFNEIGGAAAVGNAVGQPMNTAPNPAVAASPAPVAAPAPKPDGGTKPLGTTKPSAPLDTSVGASSGSGAVHAAGAQDFATPREHYNYAFRLLNQTQYEDSAASFDVFTKKYPKDPLVGNAYYWQGETYYIRRDYVNAADNFRKGFEALPEGPKAADNLLKLSMSLNALNRDKEACLVLQQITSKYKKSAATVAERAEQEHKRIGCGKKS